MVPPNLRQPDLRPSSLIEQVKREEAKYPYAAPLVVGREVQRNMSTGWSDPLFRPQPEIEIWQAMDWKLYKVAIKSKHSIDWAPIPVFDDDPTCYPNAWDFLGDTKMNIVSSETLMA